MNLGKVAQHNENAAAFPSRCDATPCRYRDPYGVTEGLEESTREARVFGQMKFKPQLGNCYAESVACKNPN